MTDTITILLASCNGARHLPAQLASIAAQSHRDWRLLVSDDGSRDATAAIVDAFAAAHPGQVRRIAGPRAGPTANFLAMFADPWATGWTAFCDQDDIWHPGKLAAAIAHLRDAPGPAVHACRVRVVDAEGRPLRDGPRRRRGPSLGNALVQNVVGGHAAVLNPAGTALVAASLGGPLPAYHDWWLYLLIEAAGGQTRLDPAIRLDYRQHGGNVLGASSSGRTLLARLRMIGRGGAAEAISANLAALSHARALLTPQAREMLARFAAMRRLRGWRAVAAARALGLRRQSRVQTLAVWWAAARGKL